MPKGLFFTSSLVIEGNSKLGTSSSIAEIGGPALAGFLIQAITAPIAIAFDALSFLFSAVCIGLIRKQEPANPPHAEQQSAWQEVREGMHAVFQNPLLWAVAGCTGTRAFFGSFLGTLYGLYLLRGLELTPAVIGVLISMGGIGALVGALLAERMARRLGLGRTLIVTISLSAVLQFSIPLANGPNFASVAILGLAQFVGDMMLMIYFINAISLRQLIVPNRLLGRVNASVNFLAGSLGPLGALLAGVLAEAIGLRMTLVIAASGMLFSAFWLIPVRHIKERPEMIDQMM